MYLGGKQFDMEHEVRLKENVVRKQENRDWAEFEERRRVKREVMMVKEGGIVAKGSLAKWISDSAMKKSRVENDSPVKEDIARLAKRLSRGGVKGGTGQSGSGGGGG